MHIEELRDFVRSLPHGRLFAEDDRWKLQTYLSAAWPDLDITDRTSMTAEKLDRMEQIDCDYPLLTFQIERHGGMVVGSKNAEIVGWKIDLDRGTAVSNVTGARRKIPAAPRLDVRPLADSTARLIRAKEDDASLSWTGEHEVRVLIGTIIPGGGLAEATVAGRRKRFRRELTKLLGPDGWVETRANVFVRP